MTMTPEQRARRDALLATRATDNLLDMLDVIETGPRSEFGTLASEEHRMVRAWLIDEIERRHPEAVAEIERRMMDLPEDDATPYNVHLRDAVVAVGGIGWRQHDGIFTD